MRTSKVSAAAACPLPGRTTPFLKFAITTPICLHCDSKEIYIPQVTLGIFLDRIIHLDVSDCEILSQVRADIHIYFSIGRLETLIDILVVVA